MALQNVFFQFVHRFCNPLDRWILRAQIIAGITVQLRYNKEVVEIVTETLLMGLIRF